MPNPSRETKFLGVYGDREISNFPVQLTVQDWQPYPVDPYSYYMCDHTYCCSTGTLYVPTDGRVQQYAVTVYSIPSNI